MADAANGGMSADIAHADQFAADVGAGDGGAVLTEHLGILIDGNTAGVIST